MNAAEFVRALGGLAKVKTYRGNITKPNSHFVPRNGREHLFVDSLLIKGIDAYEEIYISIDMCDGFLNSIAIHTRNRYTHFSLYRKTAYTEYDKYAMEETSPGRFLMLFHNEITERDLIMNHKGEFIVHMDNESEVFSTLLVHNFDIEKYREIHETYKCIDELKTDLSFSTYDTNCGLNFAALYQIIWKA